MERGVSMSTEEDNRLQELRKVHEKRQTIAQAASNLGLSSRQVKRWSKRLQEEGRQGIISRKVWKMRNHRLSDRLKDITLGLIRDHYLDFWRTLAYEYLTEQHGLSPSLG